VPLQRKPPPPPRLNPLPPNHKFHTKPHLSARLTSSGPALTHPHLTWVGKPKPSTLNPTKPGPHNPTNWLNIGTT
jgi:hypothetical protein